jgi:hypothetical protein
MENIYNLSIKMTERVHVGEFGVDARIILKRILKWDIKM